MPRSRQQDSGWRIMVSGGGTGGHVFPAISIAQACKALRPDCSVHFVGARGKIEMTQVPKAGFSITGFWIRGFQRKALWKNLALPLQVLVSLVQAWNLLRKFRPHVVVGVGGYASGPLLWVAQRMGLPTALQEQNAIPGATNRFLSAAARRVYVAFEGMETYFGSNKTVVTGNPVRPELLNQGPDREEALRFWGTKNGVGIGGKFGCQSFERSGGGLFAFRISRCGMAMAMRTPLPIAGGPPSKARTEPSGFAFCPRDDHGLCRGRLDCIAGWGGYHE
jgi:UDP-N-acetylglucosamine--N-acetylmuramyl-(pentapeptide) pyrophosphoryl-undecaprenol N-acetylglucosamine transferase